MRYHLTLVRISIIKKCTNNKCWRGCEEKGTLLHCWWECKLVQQLWRTVKFSLRKKKSYHVIQQSHSWAYIQFSSVQALSHVRLFVTPWTSARQASLSITNSQSPPKPMSIELVMPSNHLILCHLLLLLPPIFPSITVFSNESALHIRWSKYWRSPVAYWALTDLGSTSFSILSFCLFILYLGFSRQEYWSGLPFPSPGDHILSDLSTMTLGGPTGMA